MPTFGSDTIWKFSTNVSELKKLAACNFEDLLQVGLVSRLVVSCIYLIWLWWWQCSILVFDGLLPEPHNSAIMTLLFTCCHWHWLAKLQMHTDETLIIFDGVTTMLGAELRHFVTMTCNSFQTKELQQETTAHLCRESKKCTNQNEGALPSTSNGQRSVPLQKKFNVHTIKNHSLGDYPDQIRRYGTTDSYSTEPVSAFLSEASHTEINVLL